MTLAIIGIVVVLVVLYRLRLVLWTIWFPSWCRPRIELSDNVLVILLGFVSCSIATPKARARFIAKSQAKIRRNNRRLKQIKTKGN